MTHGSASVGREVPLPCRDRLAPHLVIVISPPYRSWWGPKLRNGAGRRDVCRDQLLLDCLHEADGTTEVVVGLRRDALLHCSQVHGAGKVVIFALHITGLGLPIPDPAQQVGVLAGFLLNILPEGMYGTLFTGVQPGDVGLMAVRQQLVEHAYHRRDTHTGREQHHRGMAIGFQVEIAGGGMTSILSPACR